VVEAIKDDACEERVFVEKEEFNGAAYEALEGVDTLRIVTESWLVFLCTIELPTDDPSVPTFPWGPDSESRLLQLLRDAMLLLAGPNESCDDRIFLNKDGEDGDNFSSDIALSNADCTVKSSAIFLVRVVAKVRKPRFFIACISGNRFAT
jgi:hypothetical protein